MLRCRMLILLGGCLLASAASRADGVGYIDCRNHPEDTEVFAKPRKTPDNVGSIRCGDRFYILQYGFIFSRIQTGDGKVGYIYSNLIAVDTSGVVQRTAPQPQPQPAPVQSAPAQISQPAQPVATLAPSPAIQPSAAKVVVPDTRTQTAPTASPSAAAAANKSVAAPTATAANTPAKPPAPPAAAANSSSASGLDVVVNPDTGVPASSATPTASASKVDKVATKTSAATPPTPVVEEKPYVPVPVTEARSSSSEKRVNDAQPARDANAAASDSQARASTPPASAQTSVPASNTPDTYTQPDTTPHADAPAPAEPLPTPIRSERDSWERPNPGGRRAPLLELFGGYSYARMVGGGTTTNLSGGLGSIGWNMTSWLQLVADTSYNIVTASGARNVLYGNHWGPRIYHRGRNRWNISPFVEGLFGGSRSDTTVAGTKTSITTFSIKAGGGIDIKPSRHFEIRLINVDYYRTHFGGTLYQNNYWASAGIVLRLFGRGEE